MDQLKGLGVLVVGGGIAGLTAAYWLRKEKCDVHVVDQAPTPPADGTMIDFYGPGFDVAEEMGLLPELEECRPEIARWAFMGQLGLPRFAMDYPTIRRALFAERHLTVLRSDLHGALRLRVTGNVEMQRGVTVTSIRPFGPRVVASFSDGQARTYDFVVGAGGARCSMRQTWFGASVAHERYLGFDAASFSVSDAALRARLGPELRSLAGPGHQVTVCPSRGDRVSVTFLHKQPATLAGADRARVVARLRTGFRGFGDVVPDLIDAAERASDLAYDGVTQVCLARWSVGGVVLVGDACFCPSLIGGPGASLAMAGARTLVRELVRAQGKIPAAFASYERRMRPAVARAQAMAGMMSRWIAPESKLRMLVRDLAVRASVWPVGSQVMRRAVGAVEQIA